ncbi:unnamed protein product [Musa hybrid cultivar]
MWKAKAEAEAKAWETLKDAVEAYMGPSPVTFFTVLAVAVALALDFYYASPSRCPCSLGRSPRRSSVPTTAPAPSSRSSWPSRDRSMTSPRAVLSFPGCLMDLVDHMHFLLAKMQVEH